MTVEQSSNGPIRTALVGCGAVAIRGLIPAWLSPANPKRPDPVPFLNFGYAPGLVFNAICDDDTGSLARAKDILPDATAFGSWDELLRKLNDVQAVVISTPAFLHEEMVLGALDLGCDVFVEKPIALTRQGLERVAASASSCGRIVMVDLPWRFSLAASEILEVVRDGGLGEIRSFEAEFRHSGPKAWSPSAAWYYDGRNPGGAWTDLGSHLLDLLFEVIPSSDLRSFHCRGKIAKTYVERAECQIGFENDRNATLVVGWDSDFPLFRLRLIGTQDELNADLISPYRVGCVSKGRTSSLTDCPKPIEALGPFAHFISCVRTRAIPVTGLPRVLSSERLVVEGLEQLVSETI